MEKDSHGYNRIDRSSNLWHRKVAYYKIYLKNRSKYPLPFGDYEIHHIDGKKWHNSPENLAILTPEEHIDIHLKKEQDAKETKEKIKATIKRFFSWKKIHKSNGRKSYEVSLTERGKEIIN